MVNARDALEEVVITMLDLMHDGDTAASQRIEAGRLVHQIVLQSHSLWAAPEFGQEGQSGGATSRNGASGSSGSGVADQAGEVIPLRSRQA